MSHRLHVLSLLCLLLLLRSPARSYAQPWTLNDAQRTTEIGLVQEWFHRELEPSLYSDTRWSTSSVVFAYHITDWLNLGFEGGYAEITSDGFPGSDYERYSVGASLGVRVFQRGPWDISASARYLDTFDLDSSQNLFHKRVRSVGGSVNAIRHFMPFGQAVAAWVGPTVVDDLVETYPWDSLTAIESTSGTAFGATLGGRVIIGGWTSLYGFVSYVDDIQGGLGICLHAGGDGL